ncbi:hypothetical protein MTO96_021503 [Rhipicephalus appendiculatus]
MRGRLGGHLNAQIHWRRWGERGMSAARCFSWSILQAGDEKRTGIRCKSGGSGVSGRMPLAVALGRSRRATVRRMGREKHARTPTLLAKERDAPAGSLRGPPLAGQACSELLGVCGRAGGSGNASRGGTIARRRGGVRSCRRRAAGCCFSVGPLRAALLAMVLAENESSSPTSTMLLFNNSQNN